MGAMRFTDLRVWQAADALCDRIYTMTEGLPVSEEYGLKVQLRRAAVSIGSNIAEGFGRWTPRDQARFYDRQRVRRRDSQSPPGLCASEVFER